jgi:hypothetical protein
MAKSKKLPKTLAGLKVPKTMRKSKLLKALLGSPFGRDILAKALVAGAGAAAAVLVENREDIAKTGKKTAKKGARKTARATSVAVDALRSASDAMIGVVQETATSFLPKGQRKKIEAAAKH